MWFKLKQYFTKKRIKALIDKHNSISLYEPNRLLCEQLLMELNPDNFNNYKPSKGQQLSVITQYPNIESYTKRLNDLIASIQQNTNIKEGEKQHLISVESVRVNEEVKTIDDFFISSNGHYLGDIIKAVEEFRNAGLILCKLMQPADEIDHGYYGYTQRILTKLFVNLRIMTINLIEASTL